MGTDFLSNGWIGSGSCRSDRSDTNRSAEKQDQNTVLKLDALEPRFQLSDRYVAHQVDVLLPSVAKVELPAFERATVAASAARGPRRLSRSAGSASLGLSSVRCCFLLPTRPAGQLAAR
jgi:hypothetical protein